ncbi:MAG: hypothetical protein JW797_15205 [Bradymonadales bacterium]|nr:hypothetical protein [Bradymonadales bacterium]
MIVALTREVSPSLARREITFLTRDPIDLERAVVQHRNFRRCLEDLGEFHEAEGGLTCLSLLFSC